MNKKLSCKDCEWTWIRRTPGRYPKACPRCKSKTWRVGKTINKASRQNEIDLYYEDSTNQGGQEWHVCMYFNDRSLVMEGCSNPGFNVATIEVPLCTVDVTWRGNDLQQWSTRPAAHPSERGCYTSMPLVLCLDHIRMLMNEVQLVDETKEIFAI